MMGAGKSSVGRSLHRRTGMAFLANRRDCCFELRNVDSTNFFHTRRKEISQGGNGSTSDHLQDETGNHRHRGRDSIAERKCRNFKAPGSDRVARRRRGSAFCKSLANDRSTIAANEKSRERRSRKSSMRASPCTHKVADIRVDTSQLTDEEVATAILSKLRRLNRKPGSPIPAATT